MTESAPLTYRDAGVDIDAGEELVERIMWIIPEDGVAEPIPGLHLSRTSKALDEVRGALEPSF